MEVRGGGENDENTKHFPAIVIFETDGVMDRV